LPKRHPDKGGIALQVHGGGDHTKEFVRYRNIRVKRLSLWAAQQVACSYAQVDTLSAELTGRERNFLSAMVFVLMTWLKQIAR